VTKVSFYRLWGLLPARAQEFVIYRLSARVTFGVLAVVADVGGRMLVVRHTYRRPPWGLPGGMVGRGEQPDAALARELGEELGLDATVGPILHADHDARRRHLTLYYRVATTGAPRYNAELDAHRYVELGELSRLLRGAPAPLLRILAT
jgi:8-oxo-dGTP diphosphatase